MKADTNRFILNFGLQKIRKLSVFIVEYLRIEKFLQLWIECHLACSNRMSVFLPDLLNGSVQLDIQSLWESYRNAGVSVANGLVVKSKFIINKKNILPWKMNWRCTVKPFYDNHTQITTMAVVDMWSLFLYAPKNSKMRPRKVVNENRSPFFSNLTFLSNNIGNTHDHITLAKIWMLQLY